VPLLLSIVLEFLESEEVTLVPQMKPVDDKTPPCNESPEPFQSEEEGEDYLDYCAAAEAIDEALEEGGIKKTRDFAKELGFDF
jgi:hypothetical protein